MSVQQLARDHGFVQTRISLQHSETNALVAKVGELDKKVRRRGLYRVGSEVSKLQLAEMRKQIKRVRRITGALEKSLGRKVSLRPPYTRVTAITGPRRGKTAKGQRFKLRFAVTRKTRAGRTPVLNRKGQQLFREPTRYAHLAGPRRKSDFVQRTILATRAAVKAKAAEVLRQALEGG